MQPGELPHRWEAATGALAARVDDLSDAHGTVYVHTLRDDVVHDTVRYLRTARAKGVQLAEKLDALEPKLRVPEPSLNAAEADEAVHVLVEVAFFVARRGR